MSAERAIPGGPEWDALSSPHLARYLFALDFARGKRVLDAGTGAGYGAALLAQTAVSVVAVDIDAPTIAKDQKDFPLTNLTFVVDDCESLLKVNPIQNAGGEAAQAPFDLVVNFENIEHLQRPERFLAAAARLLSPEGMLLISTPDRARTPAFQNNRPTNEYHVHEWYRDEFQQLLAPHFAKIDLRVQIQSYGLDSRKNAINALRQGFAWANPLGAFLWRKRGRIASGMRSWKAIEALAAPAITDFPIVDPATAGVWGTAHFHFAMCTQPKR